MLLAISAIQSYRLKRQISNNFMPWLKTHVNRNIYYKNSSQTLTYGIISHTMKKIQARRLYHQSLIELSKKSKSKLELERLIHQEYVVVNN